ncbi:MAG: hypothetical protein J3K34DRAFT_461154 [Monoraphidium minutum]|nr:MAG: hypothetical protein J3K34DRAFT_461154 [Monoraphidium minutum]
MATYIRHLAVVVGCLMLLASASASRPLLGDALARERGAATGLQGGLRAIARQLGEAAWPMGPPTPVQQFTAGLRYQAMAPFQGRQDFVNQNRFQPYYRPFPL